MTYSVGDVVVYQWKDGGLYSDGYFLTIDECKENAVAEVGLANFTIVEIFLGKPGAEHLLFYLYSWKYNEKTEERDMSYILELYDLVTSILSMDLAKLVTENNFRDLKMFCINLTNEDMVEWRAHMENNGFEYLYEVFEVCASIKNDKIIKYHQLL